MWQKIEDKKALQTIGTGTILIKYPVSGEAVNNLDLDDIQNLLRYEIYSINTDTELLDLKIPEQDIPNPSQIVGIGAVTGILNNPPLIHMTKQKLLDDGKWWHLF